MGDVISWILTALGVLAAAGFGLIGSRILLVKRSQRRMRHRRRQ